MTTAKGYPTPIGDADNDNHADLQAIAQREDDVAPQAKTATAVTALAGTDLWTGRTLRQSNGTGTTTRQKSGLYTYDGTTWLPDVPDGVAGSGGSPTLTAVTSNPNMGTSPTQAWDWWMLGDWIQGDFEFIWGTGSPTAGSGTLIIPLPVAVRGLSAPLTASAFAIGWGTIKDTSAGSSRDFVLLWDQANSRAVMQTENLTTRVTGASPLTLGAAGDSVKGCYNYTTA